MKNNLLAELRLMEQKVRVLEEKLNILEYKKTAAEKRAEKKAHEEWMIELRRRREELEREHQKMCDLAAEKMKEEQPELIKIVNTYKIGKLPVEIERDILVRLLNFLEKRKDYLRYPGKNMNQLQTILSVQKKHVVMVPAPVFKELVDDINANIYPSYRPKTVEPKKPELPPSTIKTDLSKARARMGGGGPAAGHDVSRKYADMGSTKHLPYE